MNCTAELAAGIDFRYEAAKKVDRDERATLKDRASGAGPGSPGGGGPPAGPPAPASAPAPPSGAGGFY